jgi:hypothetical protein
MRIISYDSARVTSLFPLEEISPKRSNIYNIVEKIGGRYSFAKRPDFSLPRTELDKTGLRFESGSFRFGDSDTPISDCTAFSDGIVINAQTTEVAEAFWNDLSDWLRKENNFRDFTITPTLRFISQLVVEFDGSINNILIEYGNISSIVSDAVSEIYEDKIEMEFARFDLDFDKIGRKSHHVIPKFSIERRVNVAFERSRYMCNAPIRTRNHVEILEKIERLLG